MFRNILVPVDLAHPRLADTAIAEARRIAERTGARVTVISVVPAWPDDLSRTPSDYQPDFDAYIASLGGAVEIEGILKIGGSVSGRIEETVDEIGADLIVMASHDPKITDYLIGSNAAHVALHARCSVLVMR